MRRYRGQCGVNDPVSAWGLYKGDDDQAFFDGSSGLRSVRGGNHFGFGAGLFRAPRRYLFGFAGRISG